jgi:hypothetical protein
MFCNKEKRENIRKFLKSLPSNIKKPTLSFEPDESVTFEWYKNKKWLISISLDKESSLHYAALFGDESHYGSVKFTDIISKHIIRLIEEVINV